MIILEGQLLCADDREAEIVTRHLPEHVRLTRLEPGCLSFEVTPRADGRIWDVAERFTDRAAFDAHQARASDSTWGEVTAGIKRSYDLRDVPGA